MWLIPAALSASATTTRPLVATPRAGRARPAACSADVDEAKFRHNRRSVDRLQLAVLVSVPAAWGTFAPAVKLANAASPVPFPAVLFSAGQYVVASSLLLAATALVPPAAPASPAPTPPPRFAWAAGAELGGYLFIGNLLQVSGLATVPADRGSFLVQTTTLMVPLLQALSQGGLGSVSAKTWTACALAFVGVLCMSASDGGGGGGLSIAFGPGDVLVLSSAVLYSLHVLRLSALAPAVPPLRLAVAKAGAETVYAALAVCALMTALPNSPPAIEAGPPLCRAATARRSADGVTSRRANLIYTTQPLWSVLFAALLVSEVPTSSEALGGAVIAAALWLAASDEAAQAGSAHAEDEASKAV
ncbi:hypothetical protein EMIHUDRAFT_209322 [Emiliania huxleyi CCMP1516]|uniref:EamA domain-containing protein n=2 Tax=Emiliania huxleyi TaxID=2903 RepID=A0A0D3J5H9_EMIH1|nr:hypothetical protein EMIHUDRAFT_209322 [Emiliania huxleyi CCMP1516]EOD18764.1 hypothetical protein EMIHUDRAFT_209322 [Emiliania huxleyi CCMP1516]|eukprot:XP_005771193.1 hypothetical protein EMIHUDRAFT_209322 [Emiliania huxleyi CCMP1516]